MRSTGACRGTHGDAAPLVRPLCENNACTGSQFAIRQPCAGSPP